VEDAPLTDPQDKPTREDSAYASRFGFLRRNGFLIALVAPLFLLSLVVKGPEFILLVAVIWLGEAIVYAAVQRRRRGVRAGPGPTLQALWVVLASLLFIGGLVGLAASGEPASIVAIALGVGIATWMWSRVARSSGEDSRMFVARIGRTIFVAGATAIGSLAMRTIASDLGVPGIIVVVVAIVVGLGLMIWIVSRTLR
jgi:hypothetical protein